RTSDVNDRKREVPAAVAPYQSFLRLDQPHRVALDDVMTFQRLLVGARRMKPHVTKRPVAAKGESFPVYVLGRKPFSTHICSRDLGQERPGRKRRIRARWTGPTNSAEYRRCKARGCERNHT